MAALFLLLVTTCSIAAHGARLDRPGEIDASLAFARDVVEAAGLSASEATALLSEVPVGHMAALLKSAELLRGLRDEVPPRDGIPQGVECDEDTWCEAGDSGLCSRVCKRGSVKMDPWQAWAMQFQLDLNRQQQLCFAQMLGTHNSAITLADGYGNRDEIYSSYLSWLGTLGARSQLATNNQWLSLTDQLNLGARAIEVDVHWVHERLIVAHCGGFHASVLNRVVALINSVAKLLGRKELVWDAETVGCSPSLSSLPTSQQRTFTSALTEISDWMAQPANAREFVIVDLDNQMDLLTWKKTDVLLDELTAVFPLASILTPPAAAAMVAGAGGRVPTLDEIVASGKRVLFLSGSDYGNATDHVLFSRHGLSQVCPYTEAWMVNFRFSPDDMDGAVAATGADGRGAVAWDGGTASAAHHTPRQGRGAERAGGGAVSSDAAVGHAEDADAARSAPSDPVVAATGSRASSDTSLGGFDSECYLYKEPHTRGAKPRYYPLAAGGIARVLGCELLYGPADCHFSLGRPNDGFTMDENDLGEVTPCGVNWPSPDRLVPERAAAHLWAWAPGHPSPVPGDHAGPAVQVGGTDAEDSCAFMSAEDARWRVAPCTAGGDAARACRSAAAAAGVQRGAAVPPAAVSTATARKGEDVWTLPPAGGACPAGTSEDIPHTAFENLLLQQAAQRAGVARVRLPLAPPTWRPAWL